MESPTEPVTERRQRKLESTAARTFESYSQRSAKARSIGDVPDIADPERRVACRKDFKLFCTSYFPEIFYLPWSDDQLRWVGLLRFVRLMRMSAGSLRTNSLVPHNKHAVCKVKCTVKARKSNRMDGSSARTLAL